MHCELLDWSGDTVLRLHAPTLQDAFAQAALCLFHLMAPDMPPATPTTPLTRTLQSHSLEGLLVSWLSDALFLFDARSLVSTDIKITHLDTTNYMLTAELATATYAIKDSSPGLLVKAVTYHNLKIQQTPEGWTLEVLFDL